MMGIAGYAEAKLLLTGVVIGLLLLLCMFFKTLYFIFSAKQDRAQRTLRMFKVWLQRIFIVLVVVFSLNYACDAGLRSKAHQCSTEKSDEDGGLYFAELCYLGGNYDGFTMRLRLYSSKDGSLLVERVFTNLDPKLIWDRKWLGYQTNDGEVSIPLPPSWMSRMRAKLP